MCFVAKMIKQFCVSTWWNQSWFIKMVYVYLNHWLRIFSTWKDFYLLSNTLKMLLDTPICRRLDEKNVPLIQAFPRMWWMRGILGRQPEAEEYQVALFPGYYARDRPSKKAKNLPGSDVTYRINSASIVINTHIFSGDIGTWALVGYMVIAVLINFLRRGLSCKVCKAFENELNLPMTKSWFERIDNPCISFYTWFMWFYNSSCTIHVVYLLNAR